MKLPEIKKAPRILSIATLFTCCLLITIIMTPPEVIAKTFWYLFSNAAISLGHSPNETIGSFSCWAADNKIVGCTLSNFANDEGFTNAKPGLWMWLIKSVAASTTITIFISLYVYCINKMVLLQQEYDVCQKNLTFLKARLNKVVDVFFHDFQNRCDAMFEDSARYHKREFEVYLDTLNFQHQKQPEEKKAPQNDESDINVTSEFEF